MQSFRRDRLSGCDQCIPLHIIYNGLIFQQLRLQRAPPKNRPGPGSDESAVGCDRFLPGQFIAVHVAANRKIERRPVFSKDIPETVPHKRFRIVKHRTPCIIPDMRKKVLRDLPFLQNITQRLQGIKSVLLLAVCHEELGNIFYHMAGTVHDRLTTMISTASMQVHNNPIIHVYRPYPFSCLCFKFTLFSPHPVIVHHNRPQNIQQRFVGILHAEVQQCICPVRD